MNNRFRPPEYLGEMQEKASKLGNYKEYLYEFLPLSARYPEEKNKRYKTIYFPVEKMDKKLRIEVANIFFEIISSDLQDEKESGERYTYIQINTLFEELLEIISFLKTKFKNFEIIECKF